MFQHLYKNLYKLLGIFKETLRTQSGQTPAVFVVTEVGAFNQTSGHLHHVFSDQDSYFKPNMISLTHPIQAFEPKPDQITSTAMSQKKAEQKRNI